jgi:hypothetical protein
MQSARQHRRPSTPPPDDDYDEGGPGGEVVETTEIGEDSTHEARAVARSTAREAVNMIVRVMRRPTRGSQAQLGAATKLLELAGVGPMETEQRVLAEVLALAKEVLTPHPAALADFVHAVAKAAGRDVTARELPAESDDDGEA